MRPATGIVTSQAISMSRTVAQRTEPDPRRRPMPRIDPPRRASSRRAAPRRMRAPTSGAVTDVGGEALDGRHRVTLRASVSPSRGGRRARLPAPCRARAPRRTPSRTGRGRRPPAPERRDLGSVVQPARKARQRGRQPVHAVQRGRRGPRPAERPRIRLRGDDGRDLDDASAKRGPDAERGQVAPFDADAVDLARRPARGEAEERPAATRARERTGESASGSAIFAANAPQCSAAGPVARDRSAGERARDRVGRRDREAACASRRAPRPAAPAVTADGKRQARSGSRREIPCRRTSRRGPATRRRPRAARRRRSKRRPRRPPRESSRRRCRRASQIPFEMSFEPLAKARKTSEKRQRRKPPCVASSSSRARRARPARSGPRTRASRSRPARER